MSLDNLTPTEFSKWYLLGQSVRRMMGKGEATMYSYNGVVLPKLPEWDKEAYPYALIRTKYNTDGSFANAPDLFLYAPNAYYRTNSNGYVHFGGGGDEQVAFQRYNHNNLWDGWEKTAENTDGSIRIDEFILLGKVTWSIGWSNFDVEYNGTLYCAASEPVPVYE